jgi:hypothetical protein
LGGTCPESQAAAALTDLVDERLHVRRKALRNQDVDIELLGRRMLLSLLEPGLDIF